MEREQLTQLVLAAQQGDNNAISALFNAFQNTVYNIALRETKDPETAADVVQESFIEVIQTIGKLQEPAAFVTWLKTITYHQCTRYYRKKENKHESLVEEREDAPALFDTLEEENVEFIPDKAMESEEFRRTICAFIDKLPDVQRSAIMMKYFDDLSVKEIAAVQGVSENTVLSRLYYGRNAIKAEVEAYEKKHDTKLHAIPFLPLFRLLFNESPAQMPPVAAAAAAQAVGTATGVSLTASAVTAAGVATTVGTAAVVGTVKAAAIPLAAKIAAGIVAAAVAITAPIVIHQVVTDDEDYRASSSDSDADDSYGDTALSTQPAVVVPADAVKFEGRYYKVYNEGLSWEDAATACEQLGGHLTTITTPEEQAFLTDYVYGAGQYCYWLGGYKEDGVWRWVTNEPMDYTNWSMGEPNAQMDGENYLHLFATEWIGIVGMKWVGEWNDASNNGAPYAGSFYAQSNFGYICEWDSGRLVQATTTTTTDTTEGSMETATTDTTAIEDATVPVWGTTAQIGAPVSSTATATATTTSSATSSTTAQPTRYTKRIADYVFEEIGTTHLTGGIGGVEDGTIFLGFLKEDGPGGATVNCTYDPNLYTENHGLSLQSVYNQATDTYDWYFVSYDQAFLNSIQTGTVYLEVPPNEGDDPEW